MRLLEDVDAGTAGHADRHLQHRGDAAGRGRLRLGDEGAAFGVARRAHVEVDVDGAGHDQTAVGYDFAACRRQGARLRDDGDAVPFDAQVGGKLALFGEQDAAFDGNDLSMVIVLDEDAASRKQDFFRKRAQDPIGCLQLGNLHVLVGRMGDLHRCPGQRRPCPRRGHIDQVLGVAAGQVADRFSRRRLSQPR